MDVKHFIVNHGEVREFTGEEGSKVANGERLLPEYADSKIRYVQVVVQPREQENGVQVQIAGAYLQFDENGRLSEAAARESDDLDRFEQETCVQLALHNRYIEPATVH